MIHMYPWNIYNNTDFSTAGLFLYVTKSNPDYIITVVQIASEYYTTSSTR